MERIPHKTTFVLSPKGKLMGDTETTALRETTRRLIRKGMKHLILDLSGVDWANGSGIGCLVGILRQIQAAGGSLQLINPSRKIRQLLELMRLRSEFHLFDAIHPKSI